MWRLNMFGFFNKMFKNSTIMIVDVKGKSGDYSYDTKLMNIDEFLSQYTDEEKIVIKEEMSK